MSNSPHTDPAERRLLLRLCYRDWRPTRIGRWVNRLASWWSVLGLPSREMAVLEVRGRTSGQRRSTPVVIATVEGQRYLVSMLGPRSAWVKNVEAAHGAAVLRQGRRRPVHLVGVPPAERAPILSAYVRVATSGRHHVPVAVGAPLSAFQTIAERYPVYRIDPSSREEWHSNGRWLKRLTVVMGLLLLTGAAVVSIIVQVEAAYTLQAVGGTGQARALVLFHPSRDARFSDDLSQALAEGFIVAGFSVDRATLTRTTPAKPNAYRLIGVVSNTYYWTPDLPTLRYLKRAQLQGIAVVGVIGGAGSTARAQRLLDEALRHTGAHVIATRAFWLWRPNDASRMREPNRSVAVHLTRQLGVHAGTVVLATPTPTP